MKKSKWIFAFHSACLFAFVASSLASFAIMAYRPEFFIDVFFPGFLTIAVSTLASWPLFGGCPLTKWENKYRLLEGLEPYKGSCMVHYLHEWTGHKPNSKLVHAVLIGVMLVPVAVRFFLE